MLLPERCDPPKGIVPKKRIIINLDSLMPRTAQPSVPWPFGVAFSSNYAGRHIFHRGAINPPTDYATPMPLMVLSRRTKICRSRNKENQPTHRGR